MEQPQLQPWEEGFYTQPPTHVEPPSKIQSSSAPPAGSPNPWDDAFYSQSVAPTNSILDRVKNYFTQYELEQRTKATNLNKGLGEGVEVGKGNLKSAFNRVVGLSSLASNNMGGFASAVGKEVTTPDAKPLPSSQSAGQSFGRFLGQAAMEVPVYIAAGVLAPEVEVASSVVRGAVKALPWQSAIAVGSDALLHGKDAVRPQNLAVSALGAGIGSALQGAQSLKMFQGELARTPGPVAPSAELIEAVNQVHKNVAESVAYDPTKASLLDKLNSVMDNIQRTGYDAVRADEIQVLQNQLGGTSQVVMPSSAPSYYALTSPAQQTPASVLVANPLRQPQKLPGSFGAQPLAPTLSGAMASEPSRAFGLTLEELDQKIFDRSAWASKFDSPTATPSETARAPYALSRRLSGTNSKVVQNTERGIWIPKGNEYEQSVAPTAAEVLRQIGTSPSNLQDFGAYAVGRAHVGGLDLGFDTPAIQAEVHALEVQYPHFKDVFDGAWKQNTQELAKVIHGYGWTDASLMQEMVDAMTYVPTGRSVTATEMGTEGGLRFMKAKTGPESLRKIRNPVEQLVENWAKVTKAGENNKLANSIIEATKADPERFRGLYEVVDGLSSMQPVEDEMARLAATYTDLGARVPTRDVLRQQAMMSSADLIDGTAKSVKAWNNGELREVRVTDPMYWDWHQAVQFQPVGTVNQLVRTAERGSTRVFTALRELKGINALFDNFEAFFNTKLGEFVPIYDSFKGAAAIVRDPVELERIIAYGGDVHSRYASPKIFDQRTDYQKLIADVNKQTGLNAVITHPMDAIGELMGVISRSTRDGAALRKLAATGDPAQAASMMRDAVADPQQMGTAQAVKLLANSSFANYGLQTLSRTLKAANDGPGEFAAKVAATIVIPSVGFWLHKKNNSDIQKVYGSQGGENFYYLQNPDTREIYAFQKPPGPLGTFGTATEGALDMWFDQNPTAAKKFAKDFIGQVIPNPMPITVQLGQEMMTGKKWLGWGKGSIPIVPQNREGALPEDQAGNNVMGFSKLVAQHTGISAGQIDNTIRTLLFSNGADLADRIDRRVFDRSSPETKATWIPGMKKVTADRMNVEPLNKFYDNMNNIMEANKSFQIYKARGDVQGIRKIIDEYKEPETQAKMYQDIAAMVSKQRSLMNIIEYNHSLSPDDRRQKIAMLQRDLNQRVEVFNSVAARIKTP